MASDSDRGSGDDGTGGWFPPTSWTRINRTNEGEEDARRKALEELCFAYRNPIVTAFQRKHGLNREDGEDAAQEFLVWFLETELLSKADQARGRFRTYLLTCLDNFARNWKRKHNALKRGGGSIPLSIHPDPENGHPGLEIPDAGPPDRELDAEWARATLEAVRARLAEEETSKGKLAEWEVVREFLSSDPAYSIEKAATILGISQGAMRVRIHRLREQFRDALARQVSTTVSTEDEFREEMGLLREIFSG